MLWRDFYPYFADQVPGAANPILDRALRQASIEFFTESTTWTYTMDPMAVVEGETEYQVELPSDQNLVLINWGRIEGQEDLLRSHDVRRPLPAEGYGESRFIIPVDSTTFRLWPAPTQDGQVSLTVSVCPSYSSTGVPDAVGRKYAQQLSYGALRNLFGEVSAPYYSAKEFERYGVLFRNAIAKARIDVNRAYTAGNLKIDTRGFVRGRAWW